jgi:hypothetical protein
VLHAALRAASGRGFPADDAEEDLQFASPVWGAVAQGSETVAGRVGARWRLVQPHRDVTGPDDHPVVVISADPDLAPVGAALAARFEAMDSGYSIVVASNGISGHVPTPILGAMRQGTIIRFGNNFYLHSVETGPVPPSTFALPPTILDGEQTIARMIRALQRGG